MEVRPRKHTLVRRAFILRVQGHKCLTVFVGGLPTNKRLYWPLASKVLGNLSRKRCKVCCYRATREGNTSQQNRVESIKAMAGSRESTVQPKMPVGHSASEKA